MSEWISVEDRLPEKRTNVLISNGNEIGHARLLVNIWEIVASNDPVAKYLVTHWMPLPEPPNE